MEGDMMVRADGAKGNASLPLFAKYQFFTPGKFPCPSFNLGTSTPMIEVHSDH